MKYGNILIIDLYQWILIIPFDVGIMSSGGVLISLSHTSNQLFIPSDKQAVSAVIAMVPCPESPATESGHGSWFTINLHLSSWDEEAVLTPGGVLLGGHSGS